IHLAQRSMASTTHLLESLPPNVSFSGGAKRRALQAEVRRYAFPSGLDPHCAMEGICDEDRTFSLALCRSGPPLIGFLRTECGEVLLLKGCELLFRLGDGDELGKQRQLAQARSMKPPVDTRIGTAPGRHTGTHTTGSLQLRLQP